MTLRCYLKEIHRMNGVNSWKGEERAFVGEVEVALGGRRKKGGKRGSRKQQGLRLNSKGRWTPGSVVHEESMDEGREHPGCPCMPCLVSERTLAPRLCSEYLLTKHPCGLSWLPSCPRPCFLAMPRELKDHQISSTACWCISPSLGVTGSTTKTSPFSFLY